jgi:hypothetical protein
MLGLFGQRVGDPPRSFVDLLGNQLADLRNVVAQIEMDAVDGVADLPGLADQGIALGAQILQQRADAHLILAIGVFQRGNLVRHERLKFSRTREGALDAVAHGRHLAADCLSDRDDRLARNRLRLGETRRDFGHGLGDESQLLRAPRHVREHIEEDNRHEENDGEHGQHRRGEASWTKRGPHLGQIHPAEYQAGEHPQARKDRRGDVGRARGTALQRSQDVADRFTVVIGSTAREDLLFTLVHVRGGRGGDAGPLQFLGRAHRWGGWTVGLRLGCSIARRKRVLDRGKRRFRRILDLLRSVCHVRRRLVLRWTRAAAGARTLTAPRAR